MEFLKETKGDRKNFSMNEDKYSNYVRSQEEDFLDGIVFLVFLIAQRENYRKLTKC